MEGGSRRKLIPYCSSTNVLYNNNCGSCNNKCPVGQQCCSGQCVNILTNSANCGGCGNVCNNVPCTFGICGGYGS
ncbi:unnamed protein product [Sphagnum troendelagicum]|uniref:Stigma-specific protein Stig1 n=1 Tax=Sphagnum troendelagicum TaxID=128251 RepID=A0ABP0TNT7_9BRYO